MLHVQTPSTPSYAKCSCVFPQAPDGESQPSTEVDLFISTEKIMVLNTDLKVSEHSALCLSTYEYIIIVNSPIFHTEWEHIIHEVQCKKKLKSRSVQILLRGLYISHFLLIYAGRGLKLYGSTRLGLLEVMLIEVRHSRG